MLLSLFSFACRRRRRHGQNREIDRQGICMRDRPSHNTHTHNTSLLFVSSPPPLHPRLTTTSAPPVQVSWPTTTTTAAGRRSSSSSLWRRRRALSPTDYARPLRSPYAAAAPERRRNSSSNNAHTHTHNYVLPKLHVRANCSDTVLYYSARVGKGQTLTHTR